MSGGGAISFRARDAVALKAEAERLAGLMDLARMRKLLPEVD